MGRGLNRFTRGWLFVHPGLAALVAVLGVPLVSAARYSLHDVFLYRFQDQVFIGLDNYRRALADPLYINALQVTAIFTLSNVIICLVLGLLIAFLLSGRRIRFKTTWVALYLVPFVMTPVVAGITWRLFFWQPEFGVVNQLAAAFALPQLHWLTQRETALIATVVSNSWHLTPLAILVFYAALTTIPDELYEAARIDGAGAFAIIWHVVLPMLRPHILFVTIIIMTSAFREFDMIFTLTGGGPGRATTVLSIFAYNRGIANQDMGMANAIAFTMFIIMATIAWLYLTLYRAREPGA